MKKIIIFLIISFILTGCTAVKSNIDKPDVTPKENEQTDENTKSTENSDADKIVEDSETVENEIDCTNHSPQACPQECVVCPPCPACSSIACNTEDFCKEMGIDRSWYQKIQEEINKKINSFEECVSAGNPIMESYPRKCSSNGQVFVEQIEENEKK